MNIDIWRRVVANERQLEAHARRGMTAVAPLHQGISCVDLHTRGSVDRISYLRDLATGFVQDMMMMSIRPTHKRRQYETSAALMRQQGRPIRTEAEKKAMSNDGFTWTVGSDQ